MYFIPSYKVLFTQYFLNVDTSVLHINALVVILGSSTSHLANMFMFTHASFVRK